jgi:hypothetical protein
MGGRGSHLEVFESCGRVRSNVRFFASESGWMAQRSRHLLTAKGGVPVLGCGRLLHRHVSAMDMGAVKAFTI